MATSQNFEMFAGDSMTLAVAVKDAAGAAIDLTGASVKWALAKQTWMPELISKSTGAGIVIADEPTSGQFTITLDPTDTVGLSGAYYHEAEVTDADGNVATVMTGTATIDPSLIKETP